MSGVLRVFFELNILTFDKYQSVKFVAKKAMQIIKECLSIFLLDLYYHNLSIQFRFIIFLRCNQDVNHDYGEYFKKTLKLKKITN